jgi:hypothetical protein
MAEAPVAFRIKQANGAQIGGAPYEIRAFAKKLWWPVLDGNYGPVSAADFLKGLEIGKYDAIQVLDPSRLWYSGRGNTFEDHLGSKRASPSFSAGLPSS